MAPYAQCKNGYMIYNTRFLKKSMAILMESMLSAMENFIEEYNVECGDRCAASKKAKLDTVLHSVHH